MTTTRAPSRDDPVFLEIVEHALLGAADEMKLTLMRSAFNPIIYEVLDFSCGIFDRRGRLVAQAAGLPIFLGTLDWAVQAVIAREGLDGIAAGDVFLSNDPYGGGGTHLNDVCVVAPVVNGGALIGFTASRAHWTDVGGAAPLSVQPDAPNLHAEGIVLPVVRYQRGGQVVPEVEAILRANIRDSERGFGDLNAQIASGRIGARRLVEVSERFGRDSVDAAIVSLMDRSDERVRRRLRSLGSGSASATDHLDRGSDGLSVQIRVEVRIDEDRIELDFAGTDPATATGVNMSRCSLVSACRLIVKALIDPDSPANDGSFRALTVVAPPGSVVCATYPTAVSLYGEPARRAIDAVWRALAELIPERAQAGHYGTIAGIALAGYDDRSEPPVWTTFQGPNAGGWGARAGARGESALVCVTNGDTRNTPAEIVEHLAPLRVRALRLRDGSGGRGAWGGGMGIEYDYEVLTGGPFALTCALGRTEVGAFGAAGGEPGLPNTLEIWRGGELFAELARVTAFPLARGDRIVLRTGGGGGFGPADEPSDAEASELSSLAAGSAADR
ncbi:MAG: hydantoinase B/oxoprolinase family protein [Gaiellales bacterium]